MSHKAKPDKQAKGHLSLRVSPDDIALLDELAAARGLTGRGARSKLVRALIDEATDRDDSSDDGKPATADEREIHELLTSSARGGNVAAMHELRMLLKTPPADAGGRRDKDQPDTRSDFEKLDEVTQRRAKRAARGR
jgi:hypothetical protein